MATWTEPVINIVASTGKFLAIGTSQLGVGANTIAAAVKFLAGTSQFGFAANNVTGLVVNKGGNGTSGVIQQERMYYWHL